MGVLELQAREMYKYAIDRVGEISAIIKAVNGLLDYLVITEIPNRAHDSIDNLKRRVWKRRRSERVNRYKAEKMDRYEEFVGNWMGMLSWQLSFKETKIVYTFTFHQILKGNHSKDVNLVLKNPILIKK